MLPKLTLPSHNNALREKRAESDVPTTAPTGQPYPAYMREAMRTNDAALRNIGLVSLAGLTAGAGYRGLTGLWDMINSSLAKRKARTKPTVIEITEPKSAASSKVATNEYKPTWMDWWLGRTAVAQEDKPLYWTGALGAPLAATYAGYKGMDLLQNWFKNKAKKDELEQAKKEYHEAITSQYLNKTSGVACTAQDELSAELAKLYVLYKQSDLSDYIPRALKDLGSKATGMYLPLALGLTGASGLAAYNWAKRQSPESRLSDALKKRELLRWSIKPPELYAVTRPVAGKHDDDEQSAENEEHDRRLTAKVASWYCP